MSTATPKASPQAVSVDCPAKINLHLRVGPVRDDGFHPLLTWMTTVGLFDTLVMRLDRVVPASEVIRLTCDPPTLPSDERNLVVRVTRGLAELVPDAPPISATLRKRTPAGAGLGGGSSDAACALLATRRLWSQSAASGPSAAELTDEALSRVAARFGSDIPFFLGGPSAVCTGRGEIIRPIAPPAPKWVVLLLPDLHLPTPDVYRRFDAMKLGRQSDVTEEPAWQEWTRLPATELLPRLANDLEPPAFDLAPRLATLRRQAEEFAGRPVRMSGSGSSLFTLFDDLASATEFERMMQRHGASNEHFETKLAAMTPTKVGIDAAPA